MWHNSWFKIPQSAMEKISSAPVRNCVQQDTETSFIRLNVSVCCLCFPAAGFSTTLRCWHSSLKWKKLHCVPKYITSFFLPPFSFSSLLSVFVGEDYDEREKKKYEWIKLHEKSFLILAFFGKLNLACSKRLVLFTESKMPRTGKQEGNTCIAAYLCGFCVTMRWSVVPRETAYRRSAAAPFCTASVGLSPAFWTKKERTETSSVVSHCSHHINIQVFGATDTSWLTPASFQNLFPGSPWWSIRETAKPGSTQI